MALMTESDRQTVREMFSALSSPVRLVFFTQTLECEGCLPTKQILDEVQGLSDLITVEEHNLLLEKDRAAEYGIDRAPGIAVVGARDYGLRFLGVPAGYEFSSLLDAIVMASTGDSGLSEESRTLLAGVDAPLHIQVFSTPT